MGLIKLITISFDIEKYIHRIYVIFSYAGTHYSNVIAAPKHGSNSYEEHHTKKERNIM